MAISLDYGVAFGTMFILSFPPKAEPKLIMVLNDVRRVLRELWHGKKIPPEQVEIAWLNTQRKIDDSIYHEEDKEEK